MKTVSAEGLCSASGYALVRRSGRTLDVWPWRHRLPGRSRCRRLRRYGWRLAAASRQPNRPSAPPGGERFSDFDHPAAWAAKHFRPYRPQPESQVYCLPGGVIGNTRDFGSLVPGSSPGRVAYSAVLQPGLACVGSSFRHGAPAGCSPDPPTGAAIAVFRWQMQATRSISVPA